MKIEDPDVPLIRWLKDGAPAGIDNFPENVGVFPEAPEGPTFELPLTWFNDSFVMTALRCRSVFFFGGSELTVGTS
mgnify:CR=1 FL=1